VASREIRQGGGGRGLGSRWHAVCRANSSDLALGRGWERARAYDQGLGRFYRHRVERRAGPSAGACSGIARAGRTRVRFFLHEF
jgi:hypothetical protein